MLITNEGIIIQLRCDEISTYSRITSGVKLINLKDGVIVAKIAKVRQTEGVISEDSEGKISEEISKEISEKLPEDESEDESEETTEE
jgi:DNA gyrase subunit A